MTVHYEVHPAADLFPMIQGEEWEAFKADVANAKRVNEPIVLWHGLLIDGRNRVRAANELDVPVEERSLPDDTDPWAYVVSANLRRRHLHFTSSQLDALAADLVEQREFYGNQYTQSGDRHVAEAKTAKYAADLFERSQRNVERAIFVKKHDPEAFERLKEGKETTGTAEKQTRQKLTEDQRMERLKREAKDLHKQVLDKKLTATQAEAKLKERQGARLDQASGRPSTTTKAPGKPKDTTLADAWKPFEAAFEAASNAEEDAFVEAIGASKTFGDLYCAMAKRFEKQETTKLLKWEERLKQREKGLMSKRHYRVLLAAIHPDKAGEDNKALYDEVFQLITKLEPILSRTESEEEELKRHAEFGRQFDAAINRRNADIARKAADAQKWEEKKRAAQARKEAKQSKKQAKQAATEAHTATEAAPATEEAETPSVDASAAPDTHSEAPELGPVQRRRNAIARAHSLGLHDLVEEIEKDEISYLTAERRLDEYEAKAA